MELFFTVVLPTERSKQLLLSAASHSDSFNKVPPVITGCHFLSIKFLFGGNGRYAFDKMAHL